MKPLTRLIVTLVAVYFTWQMSRPVFDWENFLVFPMEPWRKYFFGLMMVAFGSVAIYNLIKFFIGWREDYD